MKRVIHIIVMGQALQYSHHTIHSIVAYGAKCKASVHITTHTDENPPNWERLNVLKRAVANPEWDQMLVMDADIFISPEAPSIFDEFPSGFHVAKDEFISEEQKKKFDDWLMAWGLSDKVHFNGGVMLMDRESLLAIKPWLYLPKIHGPFIATDQHHENVAVHSTWSDLKLMPSTWNKPIPGKPGPMNKTIEPAYFHHAHASEDALGKEMVLGKIKRQYRGKFGARIDEVGSILCLFRIIDQMGYHVGIVHPVWHVGPFGIFLGHYTNAKIFPCTPGIIANVGSLVDFAFVDTLQVLSGVALASEAIVMASDTPQNEEYMVAKGWKYKRLGSFFGTQAFVACVT
jgi:hypothetical protein